MAPMTSGPPAEPRRAITATLHETLNRARDLGFLGPGPIDEHIRRAIDLSVATDEAPARALDLGSGGGVPGLPLMLLWPQSRWVLLDASSKRAAFLKEAVAELGLGERAEVELGRAETVARSNLRGAFDLVVARGFAGPAVSAECGSAFLRSGGRMIVAEPPGGAPSRWDPAGLRLLGMEIGPALHSPTACQVLLQEQACPDRYPRRVGVPAKRPLW